MRMAWRATEIVKSRELLSLSSSFCTNPATSTDIRKRIYVRPDRFQDDHDQQHGAQRLLRS